MRRMDADTAADCSAEHDTNMTINRIVQQSAKRAHITAIKSGVRAAKRIDARAANVKAAMRNLAANKANIDTATARRMFDTLTAEAEKLIRDVIQFQADAIRRFFTVLRPDRGLRCIQVNEILPHE